MFGGIPASGTSLFGNPSGGSLFGNVPAGGSLFGSSGFKFGPVTTTSGGIFGSSLFGDKN